MKTITSGERITGAYYEVLGSRGTAYRVTVDPSDGMPVACTCTGFSYRRRCRHLAATQGARLHVRVQMRPPAATEGDLWRAA